MRICWYSNAPFVSSGYGQQTALFKNRIKNLGHEMAIFGYCGLEYAVLNDGTGIPIFPKFRHPYGNDIIVPHAVNWHADIVLSLMDVWVMNVEEYPAAFKFVPWYPVDHDPMPALVRQKLVQAHRRI